MSKYGVRFEDSLTFLAIWEHLCDAETHRAEMLADGDIDPERIEVVEISDDGEETVVG